MNTFLRAVLALVVLAVFIAPREVRAAGDDPVEQCEEGLKLSLDDKHDEALPLLEAGFAERDKAKFDDPEALGYCAAMLGILRYIANDLEGALVACQVALPIFKTSSNRSMEVLMLDTIGKIYKAQGQYAQALDYHQQALVIEQKIGDQAGEGNTLNNIGSVYDAQGQYAQALDYYQQALAIHRAINNQAGEGSTLGRIGLVYASQGQYAQALDYYQQALAIRRAIGDRAGEGTTLNNIGLIYHNQGQYAQALNYYQQVLTIVRELGDRAGEGTTLHNIGATYNAQGQYAQALDYFQQALTIVREVGDRVSEGNTLNYIGGVYHNRGQYAQALDYFQQALTIAREVGDRAGEGNTLNNIGSVYDAQGQYTQALNHFQQALTIERELANRVGEGSTLNNIGSVYDAQGQYAQALDYFQQALAIHRAVGDQAGEGSTLNNIGLVYANQGQYAQALDYYQQALAITHEIGNWAGEGNTLNNIGLVYANRGQYTQALDYYHQALAIYLTIRDRGGEGTTLNNIGLVYANQGQYAQALDYYQQALAITHELGNRAGEGNTLNNIGTVYANQGQYTQALDYFQQALTIARQVGDQAGEGAMLNGIGVTYHHQGQYTQALDYLQQALAVAREVGGRLGEGTTLHNLGALYYSQGQYTQALDYFQQALAVAREVGDQSSEGNTFNSIGLTYHNQGQHAQALDYFQQALAVAREIGNRVGEGITLNNIGVTYADQDQYAQALDYYQQASTIFERVRVTTGSDRARASFIAQYASLYQRIVFVAHRLKQDEDTFALSEQGRARSFLDALSTGTVELSDDALQSFITHEQETYAGWLNAQEALSKAKAQNPPDAALIKDLEKQLQDAEAAHTAAAEKIEGRDDELAALIPGRSTVLELKDMQALLDDQTTLVSYFVIDDDNGTLAFIITHNSFEVVELPTATPTFLAAQVQALNEWPNLTDAYPQPLRDLHAALIAPLQDKLKTPRVGIIPHLTLHYIPFAALTDGQTYFGAQHELFDLPSASSLRFIQQHAAASGGSGAVVLGNPASDVPELKPLQYAENEANAVATALGVSDAIGAEATELHLRETVSGTAVLHIAAHGQYNTYNPLYSALYLAPDTDSQYDGKLEVHEIFGLRLAGSELVVLSACETQVGELSNGDEVVGLTRAFMFAGAPTVLASLWNVDDAATQTLMVAFYKHWREEGMSKAQALQAAQADLRANPKWQSPYYWAGFVLSGDAGEAAPPPAAPNAPFACFPSAALLPVALLFCLRQVRRRVRK